MKSGNGKDWTAPEIVFPHVMYKGEPTFCNHRMGFYIAPSGKLLASTAYFPQSEMPPQSGSEDTGKKYFGVAIREIKKDGAFGKIYFIAQNNSLYAEDEFPFPYYTESNDPDLIAACESLRKDKLITLHWWEQIRPENFEFPSSLTDQIVDGNRKFAKAISYYHRKDGAIVALWKNSKSALSYDEGKTWTDVVNLKTFSGGYAKVWGQKTEDGMYAASWRPLGEGSWGRYPMLWATSKDGIIFDGAMHVNGEVTRRYDGGSKNIGPCNYQRGLYEGGPDIPGEDVWVVYSMSKEDIWISRIPVPMASSTDTYFMEDFEATKDIGDLQDWNIFHPQWATVEMEDTGGTQTMCMKFSDKDPFDYAKAFKVFKKSTERVQIEFRIRAEQSNHGSFEIDLGNTQDLDPVKLIFNAEGRIQASEWKGFVDLGPYEPGEWVSAVLNIDVASNRFTVSINGIESDPFVFNSRGTEWLDRLTFRTGARRGISINPVDPKEDLPLQKEAVFYVDDVHVSPR
jgi:hypothetical protein